MSNQDKGFFGHPVGLSTLFATEMWERFSYYGMRALLVLFLTASFANGGFGLERRPLLPFTAYLPVWYMSPPCWVAYWPIRFSDNG